MRLIVLPLIAAAALPLAACNQSPPPPAAAAPAKDVLADLPEAQRNATLFRAIRDGGQTCQNVVAAESVKAPGTNDPAWLARCEDGVHWQVTVREGAAATVIRAG
ncbi:MAG: hypothetical protein PGN09_10985 [Sphingomonas fennica]